MEREAVRILLIEDNPGDVRLIREMLTEAKGTQFRLESADRLTEGLERLARGGIDVVLLDLSLPDSSGLYTINKVNARVPGMPVIVLTVLEDETLAIQAVRLGAQDYLVKNQVTPSLLMHSVRYAIERKQAEKTLAVEKERLAVTLRSIGDGVITTDTEGTIVSINQVGEKLTGWTQAEAIGKSLEEVFRLVDERDRLSCENPVKKVMETREIVELADSALLIARDGTEHRVEDSAAPIRDREGETIGVVLVFHDVTEKRRMEEELRRAQKLESLGALAGGIAHDFNNYLTGILVNIGLAKTCVAPGDEVFERLMAAHEASLRAKRLTQQLLIFSKAGKPTKQRRSVSQVLEDMMSFTLSGSNIRCEANVADDLWLVEFDEGQMCQAFSSVMINAREAMPEGGTVEVLAENILVEEAQDLPLPAGKYIKISVRDQGCGIAKELLPKVFDPYFTTAENGAGLGLAIAYSIVREHDGYIDVESSVGVGTTVHIYLPSADGEPDAEGTETDLATLAGSWRILLMDDERIIRDGTGLVLTSLGYEVEVAREGAEAITLYQEATKAGRRFAVVILDLTVRGGMGGEEAFEILRTMDPQIRAIVSSGYADDAIMANFQEHGFCGVIVKPYEPKELGNVLRRVVMGHTG